MRIPLHEELLFFNSLTLTYVCGCYLEFVELLGCVDECSLSNLGSFWPSFFSGILSVLFFLSSPPHSHYMYIKRLDSVPQVFEVLFIFPKFFLLFVAQTVHFQWPVIKLANFFIFQHKYTVEPPLVKFYFSYGTFQFQNYCMFFKIDIIFLELF